MPSFLFEKAGKILKILKLLLTYGKGYANII